MAKPEIPGAPAVSATDQIIVHRDGKRVLASISQMRGNAQALRVEEYVAEANASGVATVTFDEPFQGAPYIIPIDVWDGNQVTKCGVTSVNASGASLIAKRSRGTLELSSGPFETAPNAQVKIIAIGF